jgi:glycosyltransferase involved in cell wall biosynthesis
VPYLKGSTEDNAMAQMLTAIVIARNAERSIEDCIRALHFCDRIIVGENWSQDKTFELAQKAGAEVTTVSWEGYGRTKNSLIRLVPTGWILSVDADEMITPELAAEIRRTVAQSGAVDGYFIPRKNYFLGRHIRHCGWSPDWQLRLFKAGTGFFEEKQVHEALRLKGQTRRLQHALRHYTYLTVEDYIQRLNHYTSLAAQDRFLSKKRFSWLRLLFDPGWTFIKMYIVQSGWRDGFPGTALCVFSALNTLVKHAKHWERMREYKAGKTEL